MAAAPVKSQQKPLHNFSLPHHLKWAHKNSRRRHSPDHHQHLSPPSPAAVSEQWNLRPRKEASSKKQTLLALVDKNHEKSTDIIDGVVKSKSQRLRGFVEGREGAEKKENKKRRIWVSLSKEEIEEDVFAITGSKPSRRPRKWPKNVQKQLDGLFPGLYLVGVTAEMYHDHDTTKGN